MMNRQIGYVPSFQELNTIAKTESKSQNEYYRRLISSVKVYEHPQLLQFEKKIFLLQESHFKSVLQYSVDVRRRHISQRDKFCNYDKNLRDTSLISKSQSPLPIKVKKQSASSTQVQVKSDKNSQHFIPESMNINKASKEIELSTDIKLINEGYQQQDQSTWLLNTNVNSKRKYE